MLTVDRSAIDAAWREILSSKKDTSNYNRLRALFPSGEYIEKQNFSLLHKAVLGLNPLPLDPLLASINESMINAYDASGRTALWWASRRGDFAAMSSLIKFGADVNIKSDYGESPLNCAIYVQDPSCVKLLMSHFCEINERSYGWLPLHTCSYYGCDVEILGIMLQRGVDINTPITSTKSTALMMATQENNIKVYKYLVSHNADLNMVNRDGESALHFAIHFNSKEILRLLLLNQADIHLKTNAGETLLHCAAQFGDLECLKVLHAFDLSGINTADKVTGSSPLHVMKDLKGLTALQIAEKRRDVSPEWLEIFRKLIRGVELPESKTPLSSPPGEVEEFEDALEDQG